MLTRRQLGIGLLAFAAPVRGAIAGEKSVLTVYRTPTCGCCKAWGSHLARAGLSTTIIELNDLAPTKRRAGVPDAYEACHTGLIDGYFVEGHVPAGDIRRLLAERPTARGLVVPGMPVGSPGMEVAGVKPEPFQTLLIATNGSASIFANH
ncbi:DUF411 domain-containing protein [Bosea sp. (in: a-proteobacteria)]|jgi:hypothetical protein|uniref:DUF411 domain-containing protein n=1 Tax=Bosea sp. (in: a-proteobacteria) TaxID=1871050 RepID=UPI0035628C15